MPSASVRITLAQTSITVGLRKASMRDFGAKKSVTGYHAGNIETAFDTIGVPIFTPT
jgi:hypothetical protein